MPPTAVEKEFFEDMYSGREEEICVVGADLKWKKGKAWVHLRGMEDNTVMGGEQFFFYILIQLY